MTREDILERLFPDFEETKRALDSYSDYELNLLEDNYIGKGTTFELDKKAIKGMQHMTADMQYDIVVANILADVIIPLSGVVRPFL